MPRTATLEQPQQYEDAPALNYTPKMIAVGVLCRTMRTQDGPQRDTPFTNPKNWKQRLATRAREYERIGYQPYLKRPCVVSRRKDGHHFVLDGNSSNWWLLGKFGPKHKVLCWVLDDLSYTQELAIFMELQTVRKVSAAEAFAAESAWDPASEAHKLAQVLKGVGYQVGNSASDPKVIPNTPAKWVMEEHGADVLRETMLTINSTWPGNPAGTKGSVVRGVAAALAHKELPDRDLLMTVLRFCEPAWLGDNASGRSSQNAPLRKIRSVYEWIGEDPERAVNATVNDFLAAQLAASAPAPVAVQLALTDEQDGEAEDVPAPEEIEYTGPDDVEQPPVLVTGAAPVPGVVFSGNAVAGEGASTDDIKAQEAAEGSQESPEPPAAEVKAAPRKRAPRRRVVAK